MSTLPRELIMNILSRQPVKSLCRFRCISKPWLALINRPGFVKLHLSQTRGGQRLFLFGKSLCYVDIESISINDDNTNVAGIKVVFPWFESETNFPGFEYDDASHGIGYVESIDDYKFIQIYNDARKGIDIYYLKKDSWTNVKNDFHGECIKFWGATLNGAVHWIFEGNNGSIVIGAFNLVEEKFKTLPLPYDKWQYSNYNILYNFGVLNNHLYSVIQKQFDHKVYGPSNQLWIMKDYGVKASWTRILIFYEILTAISFSFS
ncbi:hypothetical protein ACOSQ4_031842 [Xanthoceras sorbifolium]